MIIQDMINGGTQQKDRHTEVIDVSETEKKIIECARSGMSIKETAESLGLSSNTVAAYRSRLISKMGVRFISQVVRYAGARYTSS